MINEGTKDDQPHADQAQSTDHQAELDKFIGDTTRYRTHMPGVIATPGVYYLAMECGFSDFVGVIVDHQADERIARADMQFWSIEQTGPGGDGVLVLSAYFDMETEHDEELKREAVHRQEWAVNKAEVWVQQGVLFLHRER